MCMPLHKEYYIKSLDNIDQSTQIMSEINTIYFIDRELLNLYNNNNAFEELQYMIGIIISLSAIYYFVYETIKCILG